MKVYMERETTKRKVKRTESINVQSNWDKDWAAQNQDIKPAKHFDYKKMCKTKYKRRKVNE